MKATISPAVARLGWLNQLRLFAEEFFKTGDSVVGAACSVADQGFRRGAVREFNLVSVCLAMIGRKAVAEFRLILQGLSSQCTYKSPASRRTPNVSSEWSPTDERRQFVARQCRMAAG